MPETAGPSFAFSAADGARRFERKCRAAGLRVTPQRTAVYNALVQTNEHPSAEEVLRTVRRHLPHISLDTVNRTLATLSDIGIALVVDGSADAKRYDGNLQSHHHFKCVNCKRLFDLNYPSAEQPELPPEFAGKFVVLRRSVMIEGRCEACGKKSNSLG